MMLTLALVPIPVLRHFLVFVKAHEELHSNHALLVAVISH